jgi:RNA recognition motif-containing protein
MNLIVRHIEPGVTKEEFEAFFKNFGEVRSTKLVPEAGIGFVCFTDRESARNAKESQNLILHNKKLFVSFCEPKESRQKSLEEVWDRRMYDRQKANSYKSNNADVISLITSLSLLMGQMNNTR